LFLGSDDTIYSAVIMTTKKSVHRIVMRRCQASIYRPIWYMFGKCWTIFGEFVKEVETILMKMPEKYVQAIFRTSNSKGGYKPIFGQICRALIGQVLEGLRSIYRPSVGKSMNHLYVTLLSKV